MLVREVPDTYRKLCILGVHARFDVCSLWEDSDANAPIPGIYYAKTRKGRFPLLKVLFTNFCERNCLYCSNRKDRDGGPRLSFMVEELVGVTLELYLKGYIRGIFLSSATGQSPVETFLRMCEVAKRLRKRGFRGYIHLKVLPGVPFEIVEDVRGTVDRLSYNLEAPTSRLLRALSGDKSLGYGLKVLSRFGGSTQFVVDYGGDSDRDYLLMTQRLYGMGVKRVYFKAFVPVRGTPMEHLPPGSLQREHRLYQASFLMRDYGFSAEELLDGRETLEGRDVKLSWAIRHPERFPVDLARASYGELLRVPGIGPRTARRIVELRRRGELSAEGLKKLLPCFKKTAKFALFNGRRLAEDGDKLPMLPLFSQAGAFRL